MQSTVDQANRIWAEANARTPGVGAELACVYQGPALLARRQELSARQARQEWLELSPLRRARVLSIEEVDRTEPGAGVFISVEERWDAWLHRPDGSRERIRPRTQQWRYQVVMDEGGIPSNQTMCGGFMIRTAERLR